MSEVVSITKEYTINSKGEHVYKVVPFEHNGLHMGIRCVVINGEPMFDAAELAKTLGYDRPNDAIRTVYERLGKMGASQRNFHTVKIEGYRPNTTKNLKVFSEAVMYDMMFGSKLESAQKFKWWVVNEVLPEIRKKGGFISPHATPEQLESLKDEVDLWKTRALKKKDELKLSKKEHKKTSKEKNLWEKRARSTKNKYSDTTDSLVRMIEESAECLKNSNCSVVNQAKKEMKRLLKEVENLGDSSITVKEYAEYCSRMSNIMKAAFKDIEKNRRLGWTQKSTPEKSYNKLEGELEDRKDHIDFPLDNIIKVLDHLEEVIEPTSTNRWLTNSIRDSAVETKKLNHKKLRSFIDTDEEPQGK